MPPLQNMILQVHQTVTWTRHENFSSLYRTSFHAYSLKQQPRLSG